MTSINTDDRAALVAGLRGLADFLEATPAAPVPRYGIAIQTSPQGTDEECQREVDRSAAVLGTPAAWNGDRTHYVADRSFGPVVYKVVAITRAAMARWHAARSYDDCVEPGDSAVAA